MLCSFLRYNKANQLRVYIYPLLESLSHPRPHPSRLSQSTELSPAGGLIYIFTKMACIQQITTGIYCIGAKVVRPSLGPTELVIC